MEVDVWLVEGELRVAHEAWDLAEAPSVEEAYPDPPAELVSSNGKQLHPGDDGDFRLLIAVKSDGPATWTAIEEELAEHQKFITGYHQGEIKDRGVEAVVSGNRPLADMQAAERKALYDYVDSARAAGYRVRFWATNDIAGQARESLWTQLQAVGVDHTDTEDLPGLQEFFTP